MSKNAKRSDKWRSKNRIERIDVDFFFKEKENILWDFKIRDIRAQNRRFGPNFGLIGDVVFNKGRDGDALRKQFIAIDLERWNLKGGNDHNSRLILRCFDDVVEDKVKNRKVGGMFRGGIEVSFLNALNLSIAAKKPLTSFMMFLPNLTTMTGVYEIRRFFYNYFRRFLFPLYPILDEPVRYFKLIGKVGIGDDYRVVEVGRKGNVAIIDHRVLNIGGKFVVKILAEDLQYHKTFPQILILLCCMINNFKEVGKIVKRVIDDKSHTHDIEGSVGFRFTPHPQEYELLRNPRYFRGK